MGDLNQVMYLKKYLPKVTGPVLEIGSKDYGSTASYRAFYTVNEYIGVDLAEGKNVDLVLDLTKETGPLRPNHFSLGICCSVLEHVRKPWLMAENISSLIKPSGTIYISVPWVWRFHAYPDDYYRFSHRGVAELFPEFKWSSMHYSTYIQGEFLEINEAKPDVDDKMAVMVNAGEGKQRKYLPYLMVNMIGTRAA